jgi:hypothetical protein
MVSESKLNSLGVASSINAHKMLVETWVAQHTCASEGHM